MPDRYIVFNSMEKMQLPKLVKEKKKKSNYLVNDLDSDV